MSSAAPPRTGSAILFFSLGLFFFAVNDALGKWLVGSYPVGELLLVRALGAAVFLGPLIAWYPDSRRVPRQLGLHLLRILVMAGDAFAFYEATRTLPLADVMTFYLAAPLFVTVLAVVFLGERVGGWRIAALLLGFAGVVVALRPSGQSISGGALVALTGSLLFASAMVITRSLRQTHWVTLVAAQFIGAGAIGAILSGFGWVTPGPFDAALMVLVGIVAMLCFISINKALQMAPASVLAPFQYTSIVWAVLMGWLVWGDLPSVAVIFGIMLIVASGVIVWLRERRAADRPVLEPSTV